MPHPFIPVPAGVYHRAALRADPSAGRAPRESEPGPLLEPAPAKAGARTSEKQYPPQNAFAPVLGCGRSTQPGADGGECLTHHSMIRGYADTRHQMVRRISLAPPPRFTCFPAMNGRSFLFVSRFSPSALWLWQPQPSVSRSRFCRFGFAFRSSGLPWFSGLWLCDRLGNTFTIDALGRRGRDRQRLWPLLRRLFALEGYAFFAKTGSGRQR